MKRGDHALWGTIPVVVESAPYVPLGGRVTLVKVRYPDPGSACFPVSVEALRPSDEGDTHNVK